MTSEGGVDGHGNIFSVGIDGSGYQDLYDFTYGTDGGYPLGDLLDSGGTLFGMTNQRGANYSGTVFAFTLPTPEPGTLAPRLRGGGARFVSLAEEAAEAVLSVPSFPSSFSFRPSSFLKKEPPMRPLRRRR